MLASTPRTPPATLSDVCFQLFASMVETLRGPSVVEEIERTARDIQSLVATSVSGYELTIKCREVKYLCRYRYRYVPDITRTVYHVCTELSANAPDTLKQFCAEEVIFPKLLSIIMPSASQKEAAIEAYMDIISAKIIKARQACDLA